MVFSDASTESFHQQSECINRELGLDQAGRFVREMNGRKFEQSHGVIGHDHRGGSLGDSLASLSDGFQSFGAEIISGLRGNCV